MGTILSNIGTLVTNVVSWIGSFLGLFTQTTGTGDSAVLTYPILLIFVALPVVGFAIGIIKRLLSL